MGSLGQPNAAWAGDRGEADPQLRELFAAAEGQDGYLQAVAAACSARFLLPVVATGDDSGDGPNPEREAEVQAVMLADASGRLALPAFTGMDSLTAWRADARPVPCRLDELASAALSQAAAALLLDLAGPHPLVIEGDLLDQLAQGHRLVRVVGGWGWLFAADSSESGGAS